MNSISALQPHVCSSYRCSVRVVQRSKRWQLAAPAAFRGSCCSTEPHISHPRLRSERGSGSRNVTVRSWGAEVEWKEATIEQTEHVGDRMHRLIVDVGADITKGYQVGGQFVQMKVGDSKPAFLAIASPPDANNVGGLEFLIKSVPGATAELLCQLKQGDKASVSPVMGKGFPTDKVPANKFDTVLIFATGTGISPIKAVIESGCLDVEARKDVRLYYGATNADMMCYKEQIPEWEAMGVKVIKVFSSDGNGFVQDVFAREPKVADGSRTCVLLCGQKEMSEAVKMEVAAQGVAVENCLSNY